MYEKSFATLDTRANAGSGVELRVYALGDSITNGYQSSDDNGYRIGLQRDLAGSDLHFVGSKTGSSMSDDAVAVPLPEPPRMRSSLQSVDLFKKF